MRGIEFLTEAVEEQSVSELLRDIRTKFCRSYCKYAEKYKKEDMDHICKRCPMERLVDK